MKDERNKAEAIRARPGWLAPWLAWTLSTTLGWFLSLLIMLGVSVAYGMPDKDAIRILQGYSVWELVPQRLLLGASAGIIPGLVLGLLVWLAWRRGLRDAVWALLGTMLGSGLLCMLSGGGGPQLESPVLVMFRLGALGGVVGGGFSGLCQWFLLRDRVGKLTGWVWLNVAGWVIAWNLILWSSGALEVLEEMADPGWSLFGSAGPGRSLAMGVPVVLASLAGGALLGLGQWLSLRRSVKRAGWWILATTVGWGLVLGAGVGVATGTALVLLLRSPPGGPPQRTT